MTTTITATSTEATTIPLLVLGYQTAYEGRNIVHDMLGGGIAVALIAPRPRSGALELLYESEADAWAAVAMHRTETTFTLTDTDHDEIGMTYVLAGGVSAALEDQTRDLWIVTVSYQEVDL